MKIGVCGTGRMGSAIAQRLMSVGHEVGVWNRNAAKTKPLVDAGAKAVRLAGRARGGLRRHRRDAAERCRERSGLPRSERHSEGKARRQTRDRHEHHAPGHHDIESAPSVVQQGAAFVECPVGGTVGPAKEGKLFGLVGGAKDGRRARDADARANVPPHRTCRRARFRRDDETRGQSAAVGVLAGARRSPDDLQAAQSSRRPADRYPVRHRRCAGRDERARPVSSPRCWAARRSARPHSASAPPKRIWPPPFNLPATLHAELPVAASALACYEEAEAAGLGEADATAISVRWTQREACSKS